MNLRDEREDEPGKFEGEPKYTRHFWELALDGEADEDNGESFFFEIQEEEHKTFPELLVGQLLRLIEDDNGFVHHEVYVALPIRKTFGVMPTFDEFCACWDRQDATGELRDGLFHFGNDPYMGNCGLNHKELWEKLQEMQKRNDTEDSDEIASWISSVLGCLGIEWV